MSTPSSTAQPAPTQPKKSYKDSLNLPQTSFPMEAKLVQNEPKRLAAWEEGRLYEKLLTARDNCPRWVLHDGPPFANGDIHIGHLINKTLKDIILRFRTMQGYQTPYVPGWDCHGLPIEHKIQEEMQKHGKKFRELSVVQVRKECFAYAGKYADVQSEQFKRLGILGDWANPYLTMKPEYESGTLEVFAKFVEAGLVYKKLKPVPWSVANQTALADAELEYKDVEDASVFVEFPDAGDGLDDLHYLVWTTTPWTLPANLAVAVHPDVQYSFVSYVRNGRPRVSVVAAALVEQVFKDRANIEKYEVQRTVPGSELLGRQYRHPFIDRQGRIVAAHYVTTTDGSGLVHTAPGHGEDDYETGIRERLEVYSPVLANGRFDDTVPEFLRGKTTRESNGLIVEDLKRRELLFAEHSIVHSYPHDWRSKTPIIFRATEQWFIAMDKPFAIQEVLCPLPGHPSKGPEKGPLRSLRERALDAVANQVGFVPDWGRRRLEGMLESRPDWCISRQRAWGLPIPVFFNEQGKALLTPESVRAVARHFKQHGSDEWFTCETAQLLGADFQFPPGFEPGKLRKETDIFDVWFESGSSWHSVLQERSYLSFPADLYLEGSDQHRGWFQLSLLPSLGATGLAPFKHVLTHGFVVKPDGTKVSKSDKEYVKAVDEINRHGADVLRLWCSSVDYQGDIPTSPKAIGEFGDKYRKIRNTVRYLLSNLYDFDPRAHAQPVPPNSLDGWASAELDTLIGDATLAYDSYQLHRVFRLIHDFCAVQISAVYGNAMKDRLYCETPASPLRRRCQTVMHHMVLALTKLMAPILVFTADEAWEHIAHKPADDMALSSVHLALLPKPTGQTPSEEQQAEWKQLMALRDQALGQIDKLTRQIGKYKALDAEVIYRVSDPDLRRKIAAYGPDLEDLVGAGCWSFGDSINGAAVGVEVVDRRETYKACARSWKRRPDVGSNPAFPDLSARDAAAVAGRGEVVAG
jgi:isoleucyl-tRNA synthetase